MPRLTVAATDSVLLATGEDGRNFRLACSVTDGRLSIVLPGNTSRTFVRK